MSEPKSEPMNKQISYRARSALTSRLLKNSRQIIIHIILILVAVIVVTPLVWLASSSLKSPPQQLTWPPELIPRPFYPRNYVDLFKVSSMGLYFFNSSKLAILNVIGNCLSSSLAGFAFARMRFRGKNLIFAILLGTMMIPYATSIIPTFVIFRELGWINTHYPLFVGSFFGGAFSIFLFRQCYLAIPQDLMDAAEMDGASFFFIYLRIFLPLGMPILTTVALLTFLGSWNDFLGPLIFLNSADKMTIPMGLAYMRGRAGTGIERYGVVMAGSLLGLLPTLILYIFGQKYFIQGLTRAGLKG